MGNVKGSAVLLIAAVAMVVFLTGCETTKHAETMSAEELAALEKASGQGSVASEDTEQGHASLASKGDVSGTGMGDTSSSKGAVPLISDFAPQLPPSPILQGAINAEQGAINAETEATGSGFTGSTADPGSSGYEDEQFARALTPFEESMSGNEAASGDEVLRIPGHAGVEEPVKPLEKADLGEGGLNRGEIE